MRTTVLLYHDVVPEARYEISGFQSADANIYKLSCAEFGHHLKVVNGQQKIKPQLLAEDKDTKESGRQLLITFDDGGVSAILHTAPMLEKHGWRGYFFITTDYIGAPGFLDEKQIRELRARGHVIGSHSCSHPPRMAACANAELDREWRDSVRRLQDILGEPVTTASIPGGYYSDAVARSAAAAGIRILFTSEPVTTTGLVNGCVTVGRFSVQQGVSAEWVSRVVADETLPRLGSYGLWNGKKLLKAIGGELWLTIRKTILARRAASVR